jgi:hypothetical protein
MSVGDILDGAFPLLRANYKALATTLLLVAFPFEALEAYAVRNYAVSSSPTSQPVTSVTQLLAQMNLTTADVLIAFGSLLALLVLTPLVAGVVCRTVAASYRGDQLRAGEAARIGARRFFALLFATVMVHVLELVGTVFCLFPGLVLMAFFVLTAPAIVIEGLGPLQGMRRSWRLVRRRFWPVLGTALLAGLLTLVLTEIIGLVPSELVRAFAGPSVRAAVGTVVSSVTQAFGWAFITTLATLLYFDQRIRQEGLDLQVMAASLG